MYIVQRSDDHITRFTSGRINSILGNVVKGGTVHKNWKQYTLKTTIYSKHTLDGVYMRKRV